MTLDYIEIPASALIASRVGVVATEIGGVCIILRDRGGKPIAVGSFDPEVARSLARDIAEAADLAEASTRMKS